MNGASDEIGSVARTIFATCGFGRTLHVGAGVGALVGELLARGCDAFGLPGDDADLAVATARWPGRFPGVAGTLNLGQYNGVCTVVADEWLDRTPCIDVPAALAELHRICGRYAFLIVSTRPFSGAGGAGVPRDRDWWETRCFAAGFRKHGAYYRVNAYAALDHEEGHLRIPLEKAPAGVVGGADPLQATGPHSDARCVRYHVAADYVRPGDAVLDIGCATGFGSHILFQNSQARSVIGIDASQVAIDRANASHGIEGVVRFECDDVQRLATIAGNSVDFVVCFDAMAGMADPTAFLDEVKRVLRPAGRVMLCLPNASNDLRLWSWDRLRSEAGVRFLLEKGFVQTAGTGGNRPRARRSFTEVPLAPLVREAEWVLLLGMADPRLGAALPYVETTWPLPNDPGFHVSAFARDYRNPWLVKGMVTIGMRHRLPVVLDELQASVVRDSPPGSVDHGAALCGQAYAALAQSDLPAARSAALEAAVRAYCTEAPSGPHHVRWQVSLWFVGGELARKRGDFAAARQLYERCAELDAAIYSPLLGNKTLDALFRLATLAIGEQDLDGARRHLVRSVAEARRLCTSSWLNVCGDIERPLSFGFAELAQLLDKAGRAACALAVLDSAIRRPAVFAVEARGYFERVLDYRNDDVAALRRENSALYEELDRIHRHAAQLDAVATAKEAHIKELTEARSRQDSASSGARKSRAGWLRRWFGAIFGRRP